MLNHPYRRLLEDRPIERRGNRRARPLVEMEASHREAVLSSLVTLSSYAVSPEEGFWQSDAVADDIEEMLISSLHLLRQIRFRFQSQQ